MRNLAEALQEMGDWDAAEAELVQAMNADGIAHVDHLTCAHAWLAALRGDGETAQTTLAALQDLHLSEDPQDMAQVSSVEAFIATAQHRPHDALRHARMVLTHADALGISSENMRWAWPLAARTAYELSDAAAAAELLALLDSHQPGHLAPMLQAERDLARARLAGHDDDQAAAGAAFAAAIAHLRERSTPYHLAHGLLDHAQYLLRQDDAEAAALAIAEAREVAVRLRCQPLLDRVADTDPAEPNRPAAAASARTSP